MLFFFFFSSRRRHTRYWRDWSSDVCSSDLKEFAEFDQERLNKKLGINLKIEYVEWPIFAKRTDDMDYQFAGMGMSGDYDDPMTYLDRKSTRLNSSHANISYAVFCLKKKKV